MHQLIFLNWNCYRRLQFRALLDSGVVIIGRIGDTELRFGRFLLYFEEKETVAAKYSRVQSFTCEDDWRGFGMTWPKAKASLFWNTELQLCEVCYLFVVESNLFYRGSCWPWELHNQQNNFKPETFYLLFDLLWDVLCLRFDHRLYKQ